MTPVFKILSARMSAYRHRIGGALIRGFTYFFGRTQLRSTFVALGLCLFAPLSHAADISDLSALNNLLCMITSEVSTAWLYAVGVILIIVGAVAIATSESTIVKLLSTMGIGLGIASAAIPIVQKHLSINYVCS